MYFFNARFKFKVPTTKHPITGSVIAASAISPVDLRKRPFKKHAHLTRRFLDPQLYMSSIDSALDPETVQKLAAYPWFHGHAVSEYDSDEYRNPTDWKEQHESDLLSMWTREVPTEAAEVSRAAKAAVKLQVEAGMEGVILPGPLTTIVDQTLQNELRWVDAGLEACSKLKVTKPIFATIALSEAVLHVPALKNPLVHSFSNAISARSELAGAYVVLEQSDENNYFWTAKDPLMSLLVILDDLHRGAKRKVIVNYIGTFGLVAQAVGAEVWASGYYLVQRRFSLKGKTGRAYPRYHSLSTAGDIGLKDDLQAIQRANLINEVMTPTSADSGLRAALNKGKGVKDVPEWAYTQSNCTAAQRHYLEVASEYGAKLGRMSSSERRAWVDDWLRNAVKLVRVLKDKGLVGSATDTRHQQVWLDVFTEWRNYSAQ